MTQELIERLEPCPFCGGPTYRHEADEEIIGAVAIGCSHCGALGPFHDVDEFASKDEAFQAAEITWNTRDQSQSARIAERDRVIGIAADALDVADNIIAVNMGTDTPKEWDRAFKRVAKARASLTKDSTSG